MMFLPVVVWLFIKPSLSLVFPTSSSCRAPRRLYAKTAEEFIENLKLAELVDEEFDSRIKQLNVEADRLGQKRQEDADKFIAELAAEVEAEEKKALRKMESKVNVLIGKVSDRETDVQNAVQDALDAQRAADDYQKSAQLFNVASVLAALALSATLFYASSH